MHAVINDYLCRESFATSEICDNALALHAAVDGYERLVEADKRRWTRQTKLTS